jgi:hypothetical protein
MAGERMLTTRKTAIAAAIALVFAVLLFAAWMVTLLLPKVGGIVPGPSLPVTPSAPVSPSPLPSAIPTQGATQPSPGPLGADAHVDVPRQR